jgi:CO/xanthine dehydrogenase FAD-binding subunit
MHNPKKYHRPKTLDAALQLASQPGMLAVAGGALTFGALEIPYEAVVDLQDIPELRQIEVRGNSVSIGGAVTLQQVVESPLVPDALKRSITRTLPLNIRHAASVAESLISNEPLREWLAALVAWDVGVEQLLPTGERAVSGIASLLEGAIERTLKSGIMTRLDIPVLSEREAFGMAFVSRTPADSPIVNAAVYVMLDSRGNVETAFVALCGVSLDVVLNLPLSTLSGNPLNEANIASAAKWVMAQVDPVGDYNGSAEYRREMARVTVQRALMDCKNQLGL